MISKEEILVSIRCITYNHELYIEQCLEGFIMQKTNFAFEVIVHDDASTDGTAKIIRQYAEKYPNIIKPIFQTENQYSKHNASIDKILNSKMRGKYIAFCEGDDYWIDPYKLQKQVNIMEANPRISITHTSFKYYYQEYNYFAQNKFNIKLTNIERDQKIEKILLNNQYRIQTNTVLLRSDYFSEIYKNSSFKPELFLMGDTQLWLFMIHLGDVYYLNEVTAVYRIHKGSACRPTNLNKIYRFNLSCAEMRFYYAVLLNVNRTTRKRLYKCYRKNILIYKILNTLYKEIIPTFYSKIEKKILTIQKHKLVNFFCVLLIQAYINIKYYIIYLKNKFKINVLNF